MVPRKLRPYIGRFSFGGLIMLEQFNKYVNQFYNKNNANDKGISRKYKHSIRVMKLMQQMSNELNMDKEEAKVVGLLHDYGRFYQWNKYHTFNDSISIDHADYGVKLLFNDNEIEKFYFNKKHYKEIKEAIYYHNKYKCPNNILCKMIRDADKLDILYLHTTEMILTEEGEISKQVKQTFDNENLVDYKSIITNADNIIKTLAYIYDLNYTFSFKYLKENDIIEKIYQKLKNKEKFKIYFNKINSYIEEKLKEME